jgi:signal transduction histidine kinase
VLELGTPAPAPAFALDPEDSPQRDRLRLAVLAEVGLLFAQGGDPVAVLAHVVRLAVPALADWCTVHLRHQDGLLERVAADLAAPPHSGVHSQLAVPLIGRGQVLGVLTLTRSGEPAYDRSDLTFAEELARRVALFVDHAMLLRDQTHLIDTLEQMNRDLDRFAYVASHDLKAPLRGMSNLAGMLEDDLRDRIPEESRGHLQLLRGRCRRLEQMIDGILRYSRAGRITEPVGPVDVGELVREVFELLAAPRATLAIASVLPELETYRLPLQQVLLNLIGNAIKHAGGPVRITVGATRLTGAWELFVADDGPGIAPAHHEHIWGMFRTLSPRDTVEGTGLGLAIVRRIVESVGGRAWVDSELGRGATFRFTWPIAPASPRGW